MSKIWWQDGIPILGLLAVPMFVFGAVIYLPFWVLRHWSHILIGALFLWLAAGVTALLF